MKGINLLQKYPESAKIIRAWFLEKMIESLQTSDVPDEFKDMMRQTGIEDDKLAIMIDANPRMLWDVFDENKVFIFSHYMDVKDNVEFFHTFRNIDTNPVKLFKTRKEAELFAIEKAFEILEEKLTPIEFPKLEE